MSEHHRGPQPIPHGAVQFVFTLVGILALMIAAWIVKDLM